LHRSMHAEQAAAPRVLQRIRPASFALNAAVRPIAGTALLQEPPPQVALGGIP
jgi:hypothetical protein